MNNTLVLNTFLNQMEECFNDISKIYEVDKRFVAARLYFDGVKKTNPKLIIKTWKTRVTDKYYEQIEIGNIEFFITKDYTDEDGYSQTIDSVINELKECIKIMSDENKAIMLKYLQNLCKLSNLYIL